jgi:predicted RNase H-like HicB family nuclease
MKSFTAVIEKCTETGLYVGYIPGYPGAHSQAKSLDELNNNLREVIELLSEEGELKMEAEFIGTQVLVFA